MIRGRHRGLPIAIDRAVLLPSDLQKHGDDTATRTSVDTGDLKLRQSRTSMSSMTAVGTRRDAAGAGSMTEDNIYHVRRGSQGASSIFSGRDRAPRGGERDSLDGDLGSVRGFDHFHGGEVPRSSDLSDDKDAGLASGSSGDATTSLDSDKKLEEDESAVKTEGDGEIHDRNTPGWR